LGWFWYEDQSPDEKNIRGTRIVTMTNDTYKKTCEDKLKKVYISSINEAGKFYV